MKEYIFQLEDYWDYYNIKDDDNFIPTAAASICINQKDNIAYIFGGFDAENKVSNILYSLDLNTFVFSKILELNIPNRINHEMHFVDNKIIIIGGASYDYSKPLEIRNDIIVFDLKTNNYESIPIKNIGLRFTSFLDKNKNNLFYYGGLNKKDAKLIKFNIKTKIVDQVFPKGIKLDKRAISTSSVLPNGNIIIFSGFKNIRNKCPIYY